MVFKYAVDRNRMKTGIGNVQQVIWNSDKTHYFPFFFPASNEQWHSMIKKKKQKTERGSQLVCEKEVSH